METASFYGSGCTCENLWYSAAGAILCANCGAYVINPKDVTRIRNVTHYSPETCPHTEKVEWAPEETWRAEKALCLNCGQRWDEEGKVIDRLYEKEHETAKMEAKEEWIAKRIDEIVSDYCEISDGHLAKRSARESCLDLIKEYVCQ